MNYRQYQKVSNKKARIFTIQEKVGMTGLLIPTYHAAQPLVNLRYATISNRLPRLVLIQSESTRAMP